MDDRFDWGCFAVFFGVLFAAIGLFAIGHGEGRDFAIEADHVKYTIRARRAYVNAHRYDAGLANDMLSAKDCPFCFSNGYIEGLYDHGDSDGPE